MKKDGDYSREAARWVNLLVPGRFGEAERRLAPHCTYECQGKELKGSAVIDAFRESHEKASRELDGVEYLPGDAAEAGPGGVLVAVADRLTLHGRTHLYRDRLLVKMEKVAGDWRVVRVEHRPIAEERCRLKEFLAEAGPKRS